MTRTKKKSRREFLSEASGVAAAAASSGVLGALVTGCGDSPLDPGPDVSASIGGPSELQIPSFGMSAEGNFDSSGSSGPIVGRFWETEKDGFGGGPENLGEENTAVNDFSRPGTHIVRLTVVGESTRDTAEHEVVVHPPQMPDTEYPLIAFIRLERDPEDIYGDYRRWSLRLTRGDNVSTVTTLAIANLSPWRLSWEPGCKRLAFTRILGTGSGIFTYDFQTDEVKLITPISTYSQYNPSWSKNGWIAYVDQERPLAAGSTSALPELARVRPDGSERTYFSGATFKKEFQCSYPSWAPDGQSIALGARRYDHETFGSVVNRVGICENPFDANPTVRNLNSEERIRSVVEALIPPSDVDLFYSYFAEGARGVAWSPDGEWVAYVTAFGPEWMNHILCKSRVDGTGDIEVHAAGAWNNSREISEPCWSPDGKKLLYTRGEKDAIANDASHIDMITLDGSVPVMNLTGDDHDLNTRDHGAAWYGV